VAEIKTADSGRAVELHLAPFLTVRNIKNKKIAVNI